MDESIHVTFNEFDKEISWTASFLREIKNLCVEDENRMRAVQLLIEETARLKDSDHHELR